MGDDINLPENINSKDALADLLEVKAVFDSFGVPLFLTYGALLGIYRDGDFIPYDDDIDLSVITKLDYKTRKDIGWRLFDLGFMPQKVSFNVFGRLEPSEIGYNGDADSGVIVCQKRIRVTIFFFKEVDCPMHEKDMLCVPKAGGMNLISSPAKFYQKPGTIKFKGHKFITPSPIKEYLSFTYGEWKKKIKGKHALQWGQMHHGQ